MAENWPSLIRTIYTIPYNTILSSLYIKKELKDTQNPLFTHLTEGGCRELGGGALNFHKNSFRSVCDRGSGQA